MRKLLWKWVLYISIQARSFSNYDEFMNGLIHQTLCICVRRPYSHSWVEMPLIRIIHCQTDLECFHRLYCLSRRWNYVLTVFRGGEIMSTLQACEDSLGVSQTRETCLLKPLVTTTAFQSWFNRFFVIELEIIPQSLWNADRAGSRPFPIIFQLTSIRLWDRTRAFSHCHTLRFYPSRFRKTSRFDICFDFRCGSTTYECRPPLTLSPELPPLGKKNSCRPL